MRVQARSGGGDEAYGEDGVVYVWEHLSTLAGVVEVLLDNDDSLGGTYVIADSCQIDP